jgi:hypothetical protein
VKNLFFWLLAFLATLGFAMPVLMMSQWDLIARYRGLGALRIFSRADKTLYLGTTMIATATITCVVWNSLLVDRRDGLVLGALPVQHRTVVRAKVLALLLYVAIVILGMHALASLAFGVFLAAQNTVVFALRGVMAHFIASAAGSLFVFGAVIAFQGVLLALLGPRAFWHISGWLQLMLATSIGLALIALPSISSAVVPISARDSSSAGIGLS